ncbi:MAG: hypothetical protein EOO80_19625, partial [Oxalobacteraceae bacterium]
MSHATLIEQLNYHCSNNRLSAWIDSPIHWQGSTMTIHSERIPTGIPEFDAVLHGGLVPGRIHLIEGRPGTGKTTLGLRYLLEGVKMGTPGLYLSLSEAEDELRESANNHGWSLDGIDVVEMIPLPEETAPQTILLPTDTELASL